MLIGTNPTTNMAIFYKNAVKMKVEKCRKIGFSHSLTGWPLICIIYYD